MSEHHDYSFALVTVGNGPLSWMAPSESNQTKYPAKNLEEHWERASVMDAPPRAIQSDQVSRRKPRRTLGTGLCHGCPPQGNPIRPSIPPKTSKTLGNGPLSWIAPPSQSNQTKYPAEELPIVLVRVQTENLSHTHTHISLQQHLSPKKARKK